MDSFTNVDGRSIALSAVAGFVSCGASAIGASVGKTVMARSGSIFAGKLAKRMAEEATEFSANMISAQGDVGKASAQYGLYKVKIPLSKVKSNKEIRKEIVKTSNLRGPLNHKQNKTLTRQAGRKRQVIIKSNKKKENVNKAIQVGVDIVYGTSDHYSNKN